MGNQGQRDGDGGHSIVPGNRDVPAVTVRQGAADGVYGLPVVRAVDDRHANGRGVPHNRRPGAFHHTSHPMRIHGADHIQGVHDNSLRGRHAIRAGRRPTQRSVHIAPCIRHDRSCAVGRLDDLTVFHGQCGRQISANHLQPLDTHAHVRVQLHICLGPDLRR